MNDVNRPVFELALETTVAALIAIRADGASKEVVLGTLRAKMFDEKFLDRQHRQTFLKRVNEALGTGFSMNNVRQADPTLLAAAIDVDVNSIKQELIEVDELHGSVDLSNLNNTPAQQQAAEGSFATVAVRYEDTRVAQSNEHVLDLTTHHSPAVSEQALSQQHQPVRLETETNHGPAEQDNTMKTSPTTTSVNSTEASTMATEQPKSKFEQFVLQLTNKAGLSDEARGNLYNEFLAAHPQFSEEASSKAAAAAANDSNDAKFFEFLSSNDVAGKAFDAFMTARDTAGKVAGKTADAAEAVVAEVKSRFSFTGDRDEGVRSSWVAAGSALVGAVLETGHRGELTIGSGIGAVAGVVGSFFAAEYTDKKIDSQFGRYVGAGILGLSLGALGSGLGRMAQEGVGSLVQKAGGEMPELPALPIRVTTSPVQIDVPTSVSTSGMSYIAGL